MKDDFIRHSFEKVINVEKLITVFYMEFSKTFAYEGERHDFGKWYTLTAVKSYALRTRENSY